MSPRQLEEPPQSAEHSIPHTFPSNCSPLSKAHTRATDPIVTRPIRRLLTAVRAALGLALVYYVVVVRGELGRIRELSSHPWLFPTLFILIVAAAAIEALRLSILCRTQDIDLPIHRALWLGLVGGFLGYFIPGGTGGDLAKMYYLAASNKKRYVEIATVVLGDRAVGLFSMLFVILALAPLNRRLLAEHSVIRWLVLIVAGVELALVMGTLVAGSPRFQKGKWSTAFNSERALGRWIARALEALARLTRNKSTLLAAVAVSILGNTVALSIFVVASLVFLPEAPPLVTAFLCPLGMLVNALPITPGGLGVGEAAFEALFRLEGYTGGANILLAWRAATIPLLLVGGILYARGRRPRTEPPRKAS